MQRISCNAPKLKRPRFTCDAQLCEHLNSYEAGQLMNRSNFSLFLGKPGSGKTSLLLSLLSSSAFYRKVFDHIWVIIPQNSRGSIAGTLFEHIPEKQQFDELTEEVLNHINAHSKAAAKKGFNSIVIMDDVQQQLKNKTVMKLLIQMIANRRHLRTTFALCCQTYKSIPRQVRLMLTNLFIFRISKTEMQSIFSELIESKQEHFESIVRTLFKEDHSFCFIDVNSQRIFDGFDTEIRLLDAL